MVSPLSVCLKFRHCKINEAESQGDQDSFLIYPIHLSTQSKAQTSLCCRNSILFLLSKKIDQFDPFWLQLCLERMERSNITDELLTYWGGSRLQLCATAIICMCTSTSSSGCSFQVRNVVLLGSATSSCHPLALGGRTHQGTSQAWQDKDVPAPSVCAQPDHTTTGAGGRDGKETHDKDREVVRGWAGQGSPKMSLTCYTKSGASLLLWTSAASDSHYLSSRHLSTSFTA